MSEKPKRKNVEPTSRCYWWIFGTLAIVLLIGLRYPVRILSIWTLNPILYGVIALGCVIAAACFAKSQGWKHQLIAVMFACAILSGWQSFVSARQGRLGTEFCGTMEQGLLTHHRCNLIGNCPTLMRHYVTVWDWPIGIEALDYYDNPCGYPRPRW